MQRDIQNPLLAAVDRVTEDERKEFKPEDEVGVTDEQLLEFCSEIVSTIVSDKARETGAAIITEEDLAYLLIIGLCTGIDYEKNREPA